MLFAQLLSRGHGGFQGISSKCNVPASTLSGVQFTIEGCVCANSRGFDWNPFHAHQTLTFLFVCDAPSCRLQTFRNAPPPPTPPDELPGVKVCRQSCSSDAVIVPSPGHAVIRDQGPSSSGRMAAPCASGWRIVRMLPPHSSHT